MEKIYFDDSTHIWKTKLNMFEEKESLLNSCYDVMDLYSDNNNQTDSYPYPMDMNVKLDKIINLSMDICKSIYIKENNKYDEVYSDVWVNVVRSKTPLQYSFIKGDDELHHLSTGEDRYHKHTEIKERQNGFYPHYTWVYYIQMPDFMEEDDGVLYIKGESDKEYWIRPEEDDLIIMLGRMPHAPNNAPKSTIDRIVIACNVGFELTKSKKTLI